MSFLIRLAIFLSVCVKICEIPFSVHTDISLAAIQTIVIPHFLMVAF